MVGNARFMVLQAVCWGAITLASAQTPARPHRRRQPFPDPTRSDRHGVDACNDAALQAPRAASFMQAAVYGGGSGPVAPLDRCFVPEGYVSF